MSNVCWFWQPRAQRGRPAEKVVHPYSRKAAFLAREEIRLQRKERSGNKTADQNHAIKG